ncbi:MAG: hypothetical protein ABW061_20395 [Polyangiaceae bacterium]
MKRAFGKRAVFSTLFLGAVAALGGCPIYSHDDDGCWRDRDCASGYLCDDYTGDCYVPNSGNGRCVRPSDCGVNQTCGEIGRCVSGDCSFSGCVAGYHCDAQTGIWQCVSDANGTPNGGSGGGGGTVAGGAAGALETAGDGGAGEPSADVAGAGGDATVPSGAGGAAGEAGGG